jgi:hypothetical protein
MIQHHPIHAVLTDGPVEKPNRKSIVEIIRPSDITGFYICLDAKTGAQHSAHGNNLQLLWTMPLAPSRAQATT